jgi:hypothetical protein
MKGQAVKALMLAVMVLLGSTYETLAASDIREERVKFAAGTSGANIQARIKGRETIDYVVGAKSGRLDVWQPVCREFIRRR